MQTQETRGLIGTGAHWLRMPISRHWSTRYPDPTSTNCLGLGLSRRARNVTVTELITPIDATRCPGKGHSSLMNAASPSQRETKVFMNMVNAQSEANTMPTIPRRRQVWPNMSLGRLIPGRELFELRIGVDGRRPSRREVMCVRRWSRLSLLRFGGWGYDREL